ncbi:SDR family oxidoreductase [Clostridium carnis]
MVAKLNFPKQFPKQHQNKKPGEEAQMNPKPVYELENYHKPSQRLKDKVALITGGDSGIGKAISILYAKEGAKVAISYLDEDTDAKNTKARIEALGGEARIYKGDISNEDFCKQLVNSVIHDFGCINIFIGNAGEHYPQNGILDISTEQLMKTFNINVFSNFYLTKEISPKMSYGDSIIFTTSITAYSGNETLLDYSATKGAMTSFTRSLAKNLSQEGIRVNAVAPGPIWTPLIVASMTEEEVSKFGNKTPIGRAGQPVELAEAYVFLASDSASFITGETIHVNGGEMANG